MYSTLLSVLIIISKGFQRRDIVISFLSDSGVTEYTRFILFFPPHCSPLTTLAQSRGNGLCKLLWAAFPWQPSRHSQSASTLAIDTFIEATLFAYLPTYIRPSSVLISGACVCGLAECLPACLHLQPRGFTHEVRGAALSDGKYIGERFLHLSAVRIDDFDL